MAPKLPQRETLTLLLLSCSQTAERSVRGGHAPPLPHLPGAHLKAVVTKSRISASLERNSRQVHRRSERTPARVRGSRKVPDPCRGRYFSTSSSISTGGPRSAHSAQQKVKRISTVTGEEGCQHKAPVLGAHEQADAPVCMRTLFQTHAHVRYMERGKKKAVCVSVR